MTDIKSQQPCVYIAYPNYLRFWGNIVTSLLIIMCGMAFKWVSDHLPGPPNSYISLFLPLLLIGVGTYTLGFALLLVIRRKPSLIITDEGIQFGRNASIVPWNKVLSLHRVKSRVPVYGLQTYHLLRFQQKGSNGKPNYLVQAHFSEPIPQVMQQIQTQFDRQIKQYHIYIDIDHESWM